MIKLAFKVPKFFEIYNATEAALQGSIKKNTFAHYICLLTWFPLLLYAFVYKDGWLMLNSFVLLICGITFLLVRKIDSMRLELIRK